MGYLVLPQELCALSGADACLTSTSIGISLLDMKCPCTTDIYLVSIYVFCARIFPYARTLSHPSQHGIRAGETGQTAHQQQHHRHH